VNRFGTAISNTFDQLIMALAINPRYMLDARSYMPNKIQPEIQIHLLIDTDRCYFSYSGCVMQMPRIITPVNTK